MAMMEYKGYHATMDYDAEEDVLVGSVFGINDSVHFEGRTVDEFRKMFEQSVDNYLAMCAEYGDEPDKEYKGVFNVRISPEKHRELSRLAAERHISLNQFVSNAIDLALMRA